MRMLVVFDTYRRAELSGFLGPSKAHRSSDDIIAVSLEDLDRMRGRQFSHIIISDEALRWANQRDREKISELKSLLRIEPMVWVQL